MSHHRHRRVLIATFVALASSGCGNSTLSDLYYYAYDPWDPGREIPEPSTCQVTLCLTGAPSVGAGPNRQFERICELDAIPGLVENCRGECEPAFGTFGANKKVPIYDAMFDALDSNDDGRVDARDDECELNLLGFSWGGVTAALVAADLAEDDRVVSTRAQVARLLLIEPYRPVGELWIPSNVRKTRVWRQSAMPVDDCSRASFDGPYRGLEPICPADADCTDFDIADAEKEYSIEGYGIRRGDQVGHCLMPAAVRDPLMEALYDIESSTVSD